MWALEVELAGQRILRVGGGREVIRLARRTGVGDGVGVGRVAISESWQGQLGLWAGSGLHFLLWVT
jgi:hypothetical protein